MIIAFSPDARRALLRFYSVLVVADPETFASLSMINRKWHSKSNSSLLYAFHLTQLHSTEDTQKEKWEHFKSQPLRQLKGYLAKDATTNLFAAYRPQVTRYNLVTPNTVSCNAAPHGETFTYTLSPSADRVAVSSSAFVTVLRIADARPVIEHHLKVQQRPTALALSDDGHVLAVVSPEWKLNIYNTYDGVPSYHLSRSLLLEAPVKSLALSLGNAVVAVAEGDGLELFSLVEGVSEGCRRKITCNEAESVTFDNNGMVIVSGSIGSSTSCTTVVSVEEPISPSDSHEESHRDRLAHLWTTQPLFPKTFSRTTHAVTVPNDPDFLVAYDAPAKVFALLDCNSNNFIRQVASFPRGTPLLRVAGPAFNKSGETFAIATDDIQLFISRLSRDQPHSSSFQRQQRLVESCGQISALRWLRRGSGAYQTLLAAFPEALSQNGHLNESGESAVCGSLVFFDFAYHPVVLETPTENINLPEEPSGKLEEDRTPDEDVGLARRHLSIRAAQRYGETPPARLDDPADQGTLSEDQRTLQGMAQGFINIEPSIEPLSPEEIHLDDPYQPDQPRPRATLQRAATAAARQVRPRSMPTEAVIRQAGDPRELPDESDADNWVPPPPQYAPGPENVPEEQSQSWPSAQEPQDRQAQAGQQEPQERQERATSNLSRYTSTSTPNLLSHRSNEPEPPIPTPRKRADRTKSSISNVRNNFMGGIQDFRRAVSGPFEFDLAARHRREFPDLESRPEPPSRPMTADFMRTLDLRSAHSGIPNARPRSAANALDQSQSSGRRSVLRRPATLYGITSTGRLFTRSVSKPEPLTITPFSVAQPESPSVPSPTQLESLHRRHHSGSISSLRSESGTIAPRAAVGAHRRTGTGMGSPQSSQILLTSVNEAEPVPAVQPYVNGSTNPSLNALNQTQKVAGADKQRESIPRSSNANRNRSPGNIPEARPRQRPSSRLDTDSRRDSRRLSAFQNVASIVSSARSKSTDRVNSLTKGFGGKLRPQKSSDQLNNTSSTTSSAFAVGNVRRMPSRKLQRGNSKLQRESSTRVQKTGTVSTATGGSALTESSTNRRDKQKRGLISKVKHALWKSLNGV